MSATGKIVLITGATRGIGFASAKGLAAAGCRVVVASRDRDRAQAAAAAIGCEGIVLDITNQKSVDDAAPELGARFGRLDVLVNNSAVLLDHYESLEKLEPATLLETLDINLVGTFRVTQALLPLLKRSTDARIINVSSGAGQLDGEPQPYAPAYSISKAALNMLTQQLTGALPEVMVNSMCPGWCRTEMGGADAPRSAEDGADTVIWLALEASRTLRGKFLKDRTVIPW